VINYRRESDAGVSRLVDRAVFAKLRQVSVRHGRNVVIGQKVDLAA
jgi:hypothetical protein